MLSSRVNGLGLVPRLRLRDRRVSGDGFFEGGTFRELGGRLHETSDRGRDRNLIDLAIHDFVLGNTGSEEESPDLVG